MKNKIHKLLLSLYLAIFPLGQLLRIDETVMNVRVTVLMVDVLVGLLAMMYFVQNKANISKIFNPFMITLLFSYVFSWSSFPISSTFVGLLYLFRLAMYIGFYYSISSLVQGKGLIKTIANNLISVSFVIALLGFIQYILLPDMRSLVASGWDAHLFRLASTFYDPGFTGILLVLGFIFVFVTYSVQKKAYLLALSGFLVVALLLTYSRASYLAFLVSLVLLLFFVSRRLKILLMGLGATFLLLLPLLPRPEGVGVKLERTHSVYARVDNYNDTFDLFSVSPVFGIGYNNLCLARMKYDIPESGEHSCSGTITTGLVGGVTFIYTIMSKMERYHLNDPLIVSSLGALGVHSLFQNSLFYPWVLGWLVLIFVIRERVFTPNR